MSSSTWLIVGLGNPGAEYARTRHNVGFMVVDKLAERMGSPSWRSKFGGEFFKGELAGKPVVLLRPMKFMNCSGEVVVPAMGFFGIEASQVLVVHDELDLPFGRLQLRKGGGTAGHNGIASVAEQIGHKDFGRVRVGIGRPQHGSATPYVLGAFSSAEAAELGDFLTTVADAASAVLAEGMTSAMNKFHKRSGP